jgi:hypothetical protein
MTEFLQSAGIGFIVTLAIIGVFSNTLFPLFLKSNDKLINNFKEDIPSK